MNISPHFTVAEIEQSSKARELGIDNTMPSIYYNNAMNLAFNIIEPIRAHYSVKFSPNSWYRCPKLNAAVGGSKTSDHMIGAAADIVVPDVSLMDLAVYIRDNLVFDQLILENKGAGWVHVSYRKGANRKQILRNDGGNYLEGLQ